MYIPSEASRRLRKSKDPASTADERAVLANFKVKIDRVIRFIRDWVKVAVALALGLGTMVGWKRIVVTIDEKIGKQSLTYARGVRAGIVAIGTIFAADTSAPPTSSVSALPPPWVPTAVGALLHGAEYCSTRWVLTMPAALLFGLLCWLFRHWPDRRFYF